MQDLPRRDLFKILVATGVLTTLPLGSSKTFAQLTDFGNVNWAQQKRRIAILESEIAYIERGLPKGEGRPIVFLHGNPTSSYLWRNIIPYVENQGYCIAPDLIGLGDSGRFSDSRLGSYDYFTTSEYLFEFMDAMNFDEKIILVVHDWGSTLGIDWAKNNASKVAGISYMAALIRPPSFQLPAPPEEFAFLRTEQGEQAVLEDNLFVETMIDELESYLNDADRAEYRRPFLIPGESRRATITWPRLIPFGGEPKAMDEKWVELAEWMAETDIPKLFFRRQPTQGIEAASLDFYRSFKNQTEVGVFGGHYVQEISPHAIGRELSNWIANEV